MSAPLILVVGPTASGKSGVAESLAEEFGGEIVSADALQVYRGLDVGTAKPDAETRARVPYHAIDFLEPTDRCTAGRFAREARPALREVLARGRPCFLVGGSGFYVQAALDGLDEMPRTDERWRRTLEAACDSRGVEALHAALARLDPAWAARIGPRDRQRIVRALEVVLRSGRTLAQQPSTPEFRPRPTFEWGLRWPRSVLYERIGQRVDRMIREGWLAEVEGLLARGVPSSAHALQAIGYRDLVSVVEGRLDLEAARTRIRRATRRYARRQDSWFGRRDSIEWVEIDPGRPAALLEELRERLAAWLDAKK